MSKTAKPAAEPTEYVVLRCSYDIKVDPTEIDSPTWTAIANEEARSAPEAIRRTAAKLTDPAGQYVAVPIRSWKPVTVTAEVQTRLKLESA